MKPVITRGTELTIGTVTHIAHDCVHLNYKGTKTTASFKAVANIWEATKK